MSSMLYSARWLKSTGRRALLPNTSSNGVYFVDSYLAWVATNMLMCTYGQEECTFFDVSHVVG